MEKRFIAILLCIILVLTGLPIKSFAAEKTSATLIELKGDVQIIRSGGEKPFKAFLNMKLSEGDRIITGSSATAKIQLDDEVVISLAENTSIYLSELRTSKDSKQSSISLQSGGVGSSIKKKLTDNSRFEIKTPTAVMGVRGTEFFTQYFKGKVDIKVVDGSVEILVNINQEGDIIGIGQDRAQSYRYLVGALQQTSFNEGQAAKGLPKTLEPLDFKGLPLAFLERIKEIIKEDSNSIPKEIADTLEQAIKQAITDIENKINDKDLAPDEFSSNSGNKSPGNIQQSAPVTSLPEPPQNPAPGSGSDYTPNPTPDPATIGVESVSIDQTSIELKVGETSSLVATVNPENATNKNVTWRSSDALVASVDNNGKVTALKAGSANITVTTEDGGKTANAVVTIIIPVESVSIDQSFIQLEVGQTSSLVATVNPQNATNKYIAWSSSNIEVANVDSEGKVTALSPGNATITARSVYSNKTASTEVTVIPALIAVESVTINETSMLLEVGEIYDLEATVNPENASNKNITWSSSNIEIAIVDDLGNVTAVSPGTATITATTVDGGKTASITVNVTTPLEHFDFQNKPGEAILTGFYINGKNQGLDKILDPIIPSKSDNGTPVTAIGEGAFAETGITSVIIPESIRSIGDSAFAENPALNIIEIGSNVEIGENSFGDDIFKNAYSAGGTYYKTSTDLDFELIGSWSQEKPAEYFNIRYQSQYISQYISNEDIIHLDLSETDNILYLDLVSYIENIEYDLFKLNENGEYIKLEYEEYSTDSTQRRSISISDLTAGEIKIKIRANVKDYDDHIISFTLIDALIVQ